jgi:hypothetical protein
MQQQQALVEVALVVVMRQPLVQGRLIRSRSLVLETEIKQQQVVEEVLLVRYHGDRQSQRQRLVVVIIIITMPHNSLRTMLLLQWEMPAFRSGLHQLDSLNAKLINAIYYYYSIY